MRKRRTRIVIGSALAFLMIAAALLALCFMDNHINRHELYIRSFFWGREPFDEAEWKRPHPYESLNDGEEDKRGRMLFSFLWKHRLMGMEREQVEKRLGPPDRSGGDYAIGSLTGLGWDPDVLYIDYDDTGKVRNFHTEQH